MLVVGVVGIDIMECLWVQTLEAPRFAVFISFCNFAQQRRPPQDVQEKPAPGSEPALGP